MAGGKGTQAAGYNIITGASAYTNNAFGGWRRKGKHTHSSRPVVLKAPAPRPVSGVSVASPRSAAWYLTCALSMVRVWRP